jgi:hypothetical protein
VNRLATAVVALATLLLVGGCSSSGSSAAPSASGVTALDAGSHKTTTFQPLTTYTVPTGWAITAEIAGYFALNPVGDRDNGFYLFRGVQALSQDPTCPAKAEPGVGTTASDLLAWMRSLKGLNVSQPVMVSVGGHAGTQVDLSIHSDWKTGCSFANGLPTVSLFHSDSANWWLAGDEKARMTFIDLPGSGLIVTDLDSFSGTGFGDLLTKGAPIVQSLQFASQ